MNKYDEKHLRDMLEAIRRIEEYTRGGREAFFSSTMIQDAVIRNIEIIGEAAGRLGVIAHLRRDIPWKEIKGMRNVLIHDYGKVDIHLVWDTVSKDVPDLKKKLLELLDE